MSSTPDPTAKKYEPTSPEELLARTKRRSLTMRQRRLFGAGGSLVVVAVLVLTSLLLPGSGRPRGQIYVAEHIGSAYELTAAEAPAAPAPSNVAKEVEAAEVSFSLKLLDQLAGSKNSSNQLVSPSSLATALAMLEPGARGTTEQGIAAALQTAGLSASEQAAGWYSLAALLAAETSTTGNDLAKIPELDIANALFLQQHFAIEPAFLRTLSSEFGTGVWEVNFEHDLAGATNAINQWTRTNTKGLIKKLFSPNALNPYTRLVLADAVHFHADWAQAFKSATKNQAFYLESGAPVNVPFMNSRTPGPSGSPKQLTVPVVETGQYDAVELPYGGKKLSALIVMPKGSSLSSYVSSLTPATLNGLVARMPSMPLKLSMPTFTIRSDNHLNKTLSAMGMSQAFSQTADFSGINSKVALQVQAVEQRAFLQVTPKGTVAAAATGVAVGPTSIEEPLPIVLNHPFLFLVRDNATGAILFESMVENPAG